MLSALWSVFCRQFPTQIMAYADFLNFWLSDRWLTIVCGRPNSKDRKLWIPRVFVFLSPKRTFQRTYSICRPDSRFSSDLQSLFLMNKMYWHINKTIKRRGSIALYSASSVMCPWYQGVIKKEKKVSGVMSCLDLVLPGYITVMNFTLIYLRVHKK